MSIIIASRTLGAFEIDALLVENHTSELEITDNPVEDGSQINDHSYTKPNIVTLEIANNNAADSFAEIRRVQATREPFSVVTGLSVYNNMLIQSIDATRDKTTSTILSATITLKELIIVGTRSTTVSIDFVNIGQSNDQNVNDRISPTLERGDVQVGIVDDFEAQAIIAGVAGLE